MSRISDDNFKPRNGHTLIVRVVCRISGCQDQKELSLDDQLAYATEYISERHDGPVEYRVISTKAKGESLDRPELAEIEAAYEDGEDDVFIYDDISRLVRGGETVRLFGIGVDNGIRSIGINDGVDTADPTWEEDALNASGENVALCNRTSMRIKQKTMNRFEKFGATAKRPITGYIVPEDAKSFDDWRKDPTTEEFMHEGFRILRETLNGADVARYFKRKNVPLGPLARIEGWDGTKVLRLYRNPILKGMPGRGFKRTEKQFKKGRRRSKPNPHGPKHYLAPHLAFFNPVDFDELIAALAEKNRNCRRKGAGTSGDIRVNVPRKQTRCLGQHGRCWYCGCHHVWGANGVTDSLMCSNSRKWQCWNSIGYNGELAAKRLMEVFTRELYALEEFDEQYRELIERAGHSDRSDLASRWQRLNADESDLARMQANLAAAIAQYGPQPMFQAKVDEIKTKELKLKVERRKLARASKDRLEVPESIVALRELLEQEFVGAAMESPEFGQLMRKLCPDFFVYLVRLCDGGHLLPRARVRLALDGIVRDRAFVPGLDELLRRDVTIDLFVPPERERIRLEAVNWQRSGLSHRAIAARIGETDEQPTATAVQNALKLHDRMTALGLESPYVLITAPPDDYGKLRRHKNEAYQFVPLDGYVPPPLF